MKVLFAVNDEKDAESITRMYQKDYKEIISSKTVYYYNAIIKELQKDKTYDRIVISEDLEMFSSDNYQAVDKFIFEKMDLISDEATNADGSDIPIILLCMDRRTKNDPILVKLFGLGIYNVLIGQDRSVRNVVDLMYRPRNKKEAKAYYKVEAEKISYTSNTSDNGVSESEIQNILNHYKRIGGNTQKCVQSFDSIVSQYSQEQVKLIIKTLPNSVRAILENNSNSYRKIMGITGKKNDAASLEDQKDYVEKEIDLGNRLTQPVIIPTAVASKKISKAKGDLKNKEMIEKKKEQERKAKEKAVAEARRKEEERKAKEKAEAEARRKEEERKAKEKAEAEARRKEEERKAREKAEAEARRKEEERKAKEKAEAEARRREEEKMAKEKEEKNKMKKKNEKVENQVEETPVKRGRGRPRKNPIVTEALEDVPIKKKRGRPRKNAVVEEETVLENEVNNNIDEDIVVKSKGKKKKIEDKKDEDIKDDILLDFDDFEDENDSSDNDIELNDYDDVDNNDDDDFNFDDYEFDDTDENDEIEENEESPEFEDYDEENYDEEDYDEDDDNLEENEEDDEFDYDYDDIEDEDETLPGFDDYNEDEEVDEEETEESDEVEDDEDYDFDYDDLDDDELPKFDDEEDEESEEDEGEKSEEADEDDDYDFDYDDLDDDNDDETLPGFDDYEEDEKVSDEESNESEVETQEDDEDDYDFDYDDLEEDDETLPGFDDYDEEDSEENDELPEKQHNGSFKGISNKNYKYDNDLASSIKDLKETEETTSYNIDTDNLITSDQKIVSFVGTTKNGTSFIVNNLAELFSNRGIKTAILDLTKNKNAYYIYTNNEDDLRAKAHNCFENLKNGIDDGIVINKNLTVFTSLPNEDDSLDDVTNIIHTLLSNYTIVLLDCDFETDVRYFKAAQEIYLVQSLDVLTIQPLTGFLRDLKVKNILEQNKLRIVINKNIKVGSLNEKVLIGGMSVYNDPGMTYMTELFNRDTIKYATIPFEDQVYSKYLEALVNCRISSKGYSKNFIASLSRLGDMVYPTINGKRVKNNYNNYSSQNAFSNNTNSILDKMKKNY